MERLTTNDPLGNVETAHNLFYVKNAEVWVCGGGAAPDYADITLYDFIRQIVQSLGPMSIDTSVPDEELGEELCELLFDGTGTIEGLVATLYTAAWAFADLRNRLASYEDTGLEPQMISEILDSVSEWYDAHKEGRLLVLPCKVGAPVWFIVQDVDDPGRWEICEPQKITEVGTRGFWISGLLDEPDGMHMFTPWSALGSEAFLSREAAEAALEAREGA